VKILSPQIYNPPGHWSQPRVAHSCLRSLEALSWRRVHSGRPIATTVQAIIHMNNMIHNVKNCFAKHASNFLGFVLYHVPTVTVMMRQHLMTVLETMEGKQCANALCGTSKFLGVQLNVLHQLCKLLCVCFNRIRHVRRGCLLNTFTGLNILTVVIALGVAASQILVIVQLSDLPRELQSCISGITCESLLCICRCLLE
jgi:hypothetical protein